MKRLITKEFFSALQKDTEIDIHVLKSMYDEFAAYIFSEYANSKDRTAYHNALVLTLSELTGIAKQYRKKPFKYVVCAIELIERQVEWIEKQILEEQRIYRCPFSCEVVKPNTLLWTGSIADCVELIYALHASGSIDNGNISLKKMFHSVGTFFEIEVKEFSRSFTDIKNRVKGDRTKFLDELKRGLMTKMEKVDERPSRGRGKQLRIKN